MTIEEIREWLEEHLDDVFCILEFEPDDELLDHHSYFQYWLGGDQFDDAGYTFHAIGQDGSGGKFAVWSRPESNEPKPLVFFGSEGGHGVVASLFTNWPLMIAHGVGIEEYGPDNGPTLVDPKINENFDADYDELDKAQAALARYRDATIAKFGPLPDFASLSAGRAELNAELRSWVVRNNLRAES